MKKLISVALITIFCLIGTQAYALDFTTTEIRQGEKQMKSIEANILRNWEKTRTREIEKIERKMRTLKKNSRQYALLWEVRATIMGKSSPQSFKLTVPPITNNTTINPLNGSQTPVNANAVQTTTPTIIVSPSSSSIFRDELEAQIGKLKKAIEEDNTTIQTLEIYNAQYRVQIEIINTKYSPIIALKREQNETSFKNWKLALAKLGLNLTPAGLNALEETYDNNSKYITGLETERDSVLSWIQASLLKNTQSIESLQKWIYKLQENLNNLSALR